jgi:hypothetical protein
LGFDRSQGNAANSSPLPVPSQKQLALGRCILARQGSQFRREILKTEIDVERGGICFEKPGHLSDILS